MRRDAPLWIPAAIIVGAAGVIAISLPGHREAQSVAPAENNIRNQAVKVRVRLNELNPLPTGEARSLTRERWEVLMTVVKIIEGDPAIQGRTWTFLVHSPSISFMAIPKPGDEFEITLPKYPEQPYRGEFDVAESQ